jgi:cytochrome c peroxidase
MWIGWWLQACAGGNAEETGWVDPFNAEEAERVLRLTPLPPVPPDPTNAWSDDPDAAHLGRWLFFDPRLSSNGEVSCATCHNPATGFSDGRTLSEGLSTTGRHAPSVWNAAYNRWMFWDGRADSLWAQALQPLEDVREHGFDRVAAVHLIAGDAELRAAYEAIFGALPDLSGLPEHAKPTAEPADAALDAAWWAMTDAEREAVDRIWSHLGKAIAAYERTVVTRHAPIDDLVAAYRDNDQTALGAADPAVVEGLQLFVGRGNCHFCHLGPGLTNSEFHNIGLGPRDWLSASDRGRFDGIPVVLADPFNGAGAWSDDPAAGSEKLDPLWASAESLGQFKVPTLRNVRLVGPYFHGGQFDTLEEVVGYYNRLDETPTWGHREDLMRPLQLDAAGEAALVAFLDALTGDDLDAVATTPPPSPLP